MALISILVMTPGLYQAGEGYNRIAKDAVDPVFFVSVVWAVFKAPGDGGEPTAEAKTADLQSRILCASRLTQCPCALPPKLRRFTHEQSAAIVRGDVKRV